LPISQSLLDEDDTLALSNPTDEDATLVLTNETLALTNPLPSTSKPVPRTQNTAPIKVIKNPVIIKKDDFLMAKEITKFCVSNSMIIIRKNEQSKFKKDKGDVPEPSEITIEYLMSYQSQVRNILRNNEIKINDITRMKCYPTGKGGRLPAIKFVKGLEINGLGKYSKEADSFKRFHPDDEECPDRDEVKSKWQRLCID
jgi:hypothetical protein